MTTKAKMAYAEWQKADGEAKAAEDRLKAAWADYDKHGANPPSADLMAEVSRLRSIANDRLTVAMMEMRAAGTRNNARPPASDQPARLGSR